MKATMGMNKLFRGLALGTLLTFALVSSACGAQPAATPPPPTAAPTKAPVVTAPPTAAPTPVPVVSAPPAAPAAAPVAVAALTIYQATLQQKEKTPEVSTEELQQILAQKSATVFDVRSPKEYGISHIPGALNVTAKPGVAASAHVPDIIEIGRIVTDKQAPIVLYCDGPFCGKSKRTAEELLAAGYTNIRRYQLGIPTWRALVGVTQIELDGVRYVMAGDKTAWYLDARSAEEFKAGTLPGARNVLAADVSKAKDDGRLPMEDHNTRIIIFGRDATEARVLAEAVAKNAFHNVAYYAGPWETLK